MRIALAVGIAIIGLALAIVSFVGIWHGATTPSTAAERFERQIERYVDPETGATCFIGPGTTRAISCVPARRPEPDSITCIVSPPPCLAPEGIR